MTQVPTTEQIRDDIDSGATGEKVGFPDPAAAPLGTDAEAGGHPPTVAERAMEARASTEHHPRSPMDGRLIYLGVVLVVAVLILLVGYAAVNG